MSLIKRERVYNLTKVTFEKLEALSTDEKESLNKSIYENLIKSPLEIKNNPAVESLVLKKIEKRFGRKLLKNLNSEVERLMMLEITKGEEDAYFSQLGEILLELRKLDQAKLIINNISNDKTRYSLLT